MHSEIPVHQVRPSVTFFPSLDGRGQGRVIVFFHPHLTSPIKGEELKIEISAHQDITKKGDMNLWRYQELQGR